MRLLCVLVVSATTLCSTALARKLPEEGTPGPGEYKQLMTERAGPFRRSYRLHVPAGLDPDAAAPLVVVLHGAFSSAAKLEKQSGFDRLSEEHGFLVAYPNGMGLFALPAGILGSAFIEDIQRRRSQTLCPHCGRDVEAPAEEPRAA